MNVQSKYSLKYAAGLLYVRVSYGVPRLMRHYFKPQSNPNKPIHNPTLTQQYFVLFLLSIFIGQHKK